MAKPNYKFEKRQKELAKKKKKEEKRQRKLAKQSEPDAAATESGDGETPAGDASQGGE